jgi:hypothetical protein
MPIMKKLNVVIGLLERTCVTPSAVKKLLRFSPSSNTVSVPITGFTFPFVHRVPEHVLYHFLYNDIRGAQKIPFVVCAFARLINFSFFLIYQYNKFYLFIYLL